MRKVELSRSGLHHQRSALRGCVTAALQAAGFTFDPKDPAQARSRDESSYMVWHLPYSPPAGAGRGRGGAAADPAGATRKALDALRADPLHRRRYTRFMADMVYGERPEFDEAFAAVAGLAGVAWRWWGA